MTYWTSAIFDPGRLGPNAGTSDQSLRGLLLRALSPWPPAAAGPTWPPAPAGLAAGLPGVIWVVAAAAVAVGGFAAVRRLARQSREPEALAVTALVGVLASPVSWIHHYVVVVLVIGAILADGRARSRVVLAAGTAVYFALTIPWWGQSLLGQPAVPALAARVVQDGFGLAALVLIVILARLRAPAEHVPGGSPGLA